MQSAASASAPNAGWGAFSRLFIGVVAVLLPVLVGLLYLVDPYGTGRSPVLDTAEVRKQGVRTEHASRARNMDFNAAIFGNSRMQPMMPERLSQLTGARFVSLTVPGSGPLEQLTLLDWYLRHRQAPPRALVLGIDSYWCTGNPEMPTWNPFPFWLYDSNPLVYAGGLLRFSALEEGFRRLQHSFGSRDSSRPDGYWDYEPSYISQGFEQPEIRARLDKPNPVGVINETGRFPALEALAEKLNTLPQETQVVLVSPPHYVTGWPAPGGAEASTLQACHARLAQLTAARSNTRWVNWSTDRPENHDKEQFFDQVHYRLPVARLLEDDIARTLTEMPQTPATGR